VKRAEENLHVVRVNTTFEEEGNDVSEASARGALTCQLRLRTNSALSRLETLDLEFQALPAIGNFIKW
jgi:hypothetical protein